MGFGDYSSAAHEAIAQARATLPRQEVFTQRSCHPLMRPHGVRVRECRDSIEHPLSLGIAFALDVTGSMGDIPDVLARRELPKFMKILQACEVADPQLLFLAVGDATCDRAPLQVGQFESTAELMDQWLTWTWLEGGGGGQNTESYELALYFLAQHTAMDCWEKRQKRGYLFMTGDELPYPLVSKAIARDVLGDDLDEDIPTPAVVAAVERTFDPFFLVPDLGRRKRCERVWRDLLGDRVVCMESPEDTCYVAASIVALTEGSAKDLGAIPRLLELAGAGKDRIGAVIRALSPYATSIGKDGAPAPKVAPAKLSDVAGKSGWARAARGHAR